MELSQAEPNATGCKLTNPAESITPAGCNEVLKISDPENFPGDFQEAVADYTAHIESKRSKVQKPEMLPFLMVHPDKSDRTVVLVHGLSDSPGTLRSLAKTYFEQGFNVVGVLLTGHGTNLKDLNRAKLEDWQKDVDYGVDIASRLGKSGKVSMLGFSLGGGLVLDYARRKPGKVSEMVLLAPLVGHKHPLAPLSGLLQYVNYTKSKKKSVASPYTYRKFTARSVVQSNRMIKSNKAFLKNNKLDMPVFVITTEGDKLVSNKATQKLVVEKAAPGAKTMNVEKKPKVDHLHLPNPTKLPLDEVNPAFEEITGELKEFIKETAPGDKAS